MSNPSYGTCRDCEAQTIWLKTRKDKWVMVEQSSYHGEELFDPKIHQLHWKNCPNAREYKSRKIKNRWIKNRRLWHTYSYFKSSSKLRRHFTKITGMGKK